MNWNDLSLSNLWSAFINNIKGRDADTAILFHESGSYSNIPTGTIRLNRTTKRFEEWNGSSWVVPVDVYALTSAAASTLTGLNATVAQLNTVAYGSTAKNSHTHATLDGLNATVAQVNTVAYGDTAKNNHAHATLTGLNASIAELNTVAYGSTAKNSHTHAFRGCLAYKTANQAVTGSTFTTVTFDGEYYDTDSIHDNVTNNSILTVPSGISYVRLITHVCISSSSPAYITQASANIRKNGSVYIFLFNQYPRQTATEPVQVPYSSPVLAVTAGDYFDMRVSVVTANGGEHNIQGHSSSTSARTLFGMEIVG